MKASFVSALWVSALALILLGAAALAWKHRQSEERADHLSAEIAQYDRQTKSLLDKLAAIEVAINAAALRQETQLQQAKASNEATLREIAGLEEQIAACSTKYEAGTGEQVGRDKFEKRVLTGPRAAAETLFWALNNGDPATIVSAVFVSPSLKAQTDALYDKLSAEQKKSYGSPDGLLGNLLAVGTPVEGMTIINTTTQKDRLSTVRLNVTLADGVQAETDMKFIRVENDWQWVVPEYVVQKFSKVLTGESPLPAPVSRVTK